MRPPAGYPGWGPRQPYSGFIRICLLMGPWTIAAMLDEQVVACIICKRKRGSSLARVKAIITGIYSGRPPVMARCTASASHGSISAAGQNSANCRIPRQISSRKHPVDSVMGGRGAAAGHRPNCSAEKVHSFCRGHHRNFCPQSSLS